jgi:hypothetical protein
MDEQTKGPILSSYRVLDLTDGTECFIGLPNPCLNSR